MSLHSDLINLRDSIKEDEKITRGRVIISCSDMALIKIVKTLPRTPNDFLSIEGLGQGFATNYADKFLTVIDNYINSRNKVTEVDNSILSTLKELENKLVNINKRNKLLYISKCATKTCIDVTTIADVAEVFDLIFKKKRQLVVADILETGQTSVDKANESNYRKLVGLLREINKDLREKGQNDLFIGYPFLSGKLPGTAEDFEFNAPVVLFPVTLVQEINRFILKSDTTRDIVYNNNIILAYLKFCGISMPLPNNIIDDLEEGSFFNNIASYYEASKIKVEFPNNEFMSFDTELPKSKKGVFNIHHKMVIGKFSTYSSSMQKDLNNIIESGKVNDLLYDLLAEPEDIDMYSEDLLIDSSVLEANNKTQERELNYINTLNSTQENVLIASARSRELVIQGPPGTGKSQIITSLIANAVMQGKNALMVSEKKSALDVVYSRLGNLSPYTLLVDDVNNKDIFYSQLKNMTDLVPSSISKPPTDDISYNVDKYMTALTIIADKLCECDKHGIEIYKLYQTIPKWKLDISEELNLSCKIKQLVSVALLKVPYPMILKYMNMCRNEGLLNMLNYYVDNLAKFPIIGNFRDDLSVTDIAELYLKLEDISDSYNKALEFKFPKKNKEKKRILDLATDWINRAIINTESVTALEVINSSVIYGQCCKIYNEYMNSKQVFIKLNSDAQEYFLTLEKIADGLNISLSMANDYLYKFIINEYLNDFQKDNRITLSNINNYNTVLDKLSELLDSKLNVTRQKLEQTFLSEMKYLNQGKRTGEIKRIVESKRRPSVSKFTERFKIELFKSIKVWLLTPEVVSEILPLSIGLFDLVIFDEASQMYIEKGIPAIMRAKSVIIAGDSKQLRPSNLGSGRINIDDEDFEDFDGGIAALEEESLLDVARFKYPPVLLDFHYRSQYEELIAFSNYAFYGGKLNVSPNPKSITEPPIQVLRVNDGLWENKANKAEAIRVVELIKEILSTRKSNETIGVITFNSAQRELILDLIDERSRTDKSFAMAVTKEMGRRDKGEDIGLFIKNIENVQGDERDIVIFSIAYAKNDKGKVSNAFGWLNQRGGENRLNVAISRAKKKIYIVTSIFPNDLQVEDCKNDGPIILKKYLSYAEAISNNNREQAKMILNSFLKDSKRYEQTKSTVNMAKVLRNALERRGFGVEERVGIGSYNIDMAVLKDGNYVLGIEFDSTLYDISKNTRERDYHRWKYFTLRGWKIHRVWSSAWWNNPGQELGLILKILQE